MIAVIKRQTIQTFQFMLIHQRNFSQLVDIRTPTARMKKSHLSPGGRHARNYFGLRFFSFYFFPLLFSLLHKTIMPAVKRKFVKKEYSVAVPKKKVGWACRAC
jgi:hypothetical protein